MAMIIPPKLPDSSPNSERKVREALARVPDLTVLHSVVWQARRNGKPADGEADFVLLVPTRGIIILEVKGGGIELRNGQWYSTGANGIENTIKNPFDQAKDSKYALLSYLKLSAPSASGIRIVHAVAFPDIEVADALGFNAPRELILDRNDLRHSEASLMRIFDYWQVNSPFSKLDSDRIAALLAPTIKIRRLLRDDVTEACDALIELTSQQVSVLQFLRKVRRAAILGGAGTGKTILCVEKARQLQDAGFRTLLLCYNSALRSFLADTLQGTGIDVHTFHSLVSREMKASRQNMPVDPSETWFETQAPQALRQAVAKTGSKYDTVLVDEVQDFSADWLAAVEVALLERDGHFYIFGDSHQDLYKRGWRLPEDMDEFPLSLNCRNTRPIAERFARLFGDSLDGRLAPGPSPRFIQAERPTQLVIYVSELVESLINQEKLDPRQIAVLTDSPSIVADLRKRMVDGYLFTTLEGNGIPVETIRRFKGLERDVVIAVLTDRAMGDGLRSLAYVGLSRAKAALYVIGSSAIRRALEWTD